MIRCRKPKITSGQLEPLTAGREEKPRYGRDPLGEIGECVKELKTGRAHSSGQRVRGRMRSHIESRRAPSRSVDQ